MALEPFPGMVPNAYGANTGNVMTFGGGGSQQESAPFGGNTDVLGTLAVLSMLDELGIYGDGGPGATGGGPDAAAGVTDGGAVNIGLGPASGMPGTGGIGGMLGGLAAVGGLTSIGGLLGMLGNAITGRTPTAQEVMNVVNGLVGGGNPSSGIGTEGHVGMTGVDPATGISEGMQQAVNDAVSGGGATGGGSGEDGGVASAGGDSAGPGPGVWKGGPITKDIVRGPKPNKHDDGTTGVKVGEYMLNVRAATKIGKDVLDKLNSGDFDPAMLRFAVLRKVGK